MKKLITFSEKVDLLAIAYNLNGGAFVMQEAFELIEYKRFLDQPLAKEMFEGDKAIFVGMKKKPKKSLQFLHEASFYSDIFCISFFEPYVFEGSEVRKMDAYTIEDGWKVRNQGFIKTIHDLAELTKENQLELK